MARFHILILFLSQQISLERARKKGFAVDVSMSHELYCQMINLLIISLLASFIVPHILQTTEEKKKVMAIDVSVMNF